MDNKYLKLLNSYTLEQLQREARDVRDEEPEKAAMVYDELMERVSDFSAKLRYQRLAECYEHIAVESNPHTAAANGSLIVNE